MSLELADGEIKHPLWVKIESYLIERLATLRTQNDTNIDAPTTAYLRGQIAEVKRLIQAGHGKVLKEED